MSHHGKQHGKSNNSGGSNTPVNIAASLVRGRGVIQDARSANIQRSADDIIANARQMQDVVTAANTTGSGSGPQVLLRTREEVAYFRHKQRQTFETLVEKSFRQVNNWLRYAEWEEEQGALDRARAIYERAIPTHGLKAELWRAYAEMEVRHSAQAGSGHDTTTNTNEDDTTTTANKSDRAAPPSSALDAVMSPARAEQALATFFGPGFVAPDALPHWRSVPLWRARAVFARALYSLPQTTDLWLKFIATEMAASTEENDRAVRSIFKKWLTMLPGYFVYELFIEFELQFAVSAPPSKAAAAAAQARNAASSASSSSTTDSNNSAATAVADTKRRVREICFAMVQSEQQKESNTNNNHRTAISPEVLAEQLRPWLYYALVVEDDAFGDVTAAAKVLDAASVALASRYESSSMRAADLPEDLFAFSWAAFSAMDVRSLGGAVAAVVAHASSSLVVLKARLLARNGRWATEGKPFLRSALEWMLRHPSTASAATSSAATDGAPAAANTSSTTATSQVALLPAPTVVNAHVDTLFSELLQLEGRFGPQTPQSVGMLQHMQTQLAYHRAAAATATGAAHAAGASDAASAGGGSPRDLTYLALYTRLCAAERDAERAALTASVLDGAASATTMTKKTSAPQRAATFELDDSSAAAETALAASNTAGATAASPALAQWAQRQAASGGGVAGAFTADALSTIGLLSPTSALHDSHASLPQDLSSATRQLATLREALGHAPPASAPLITPPHYLADNAAHYGAMAVEATSLCIALAKHAAETEGPGAASTTTSTGSCAVGNKSQHFINEARDVCKAALGRCPSAYTPLWMAAATVELEGSKLAARSAHTNLLSSGGAISLSALERAQIVLAAAPGVGEARKVFGAGLAHCADRPALEGRYIQLERSFAADIAEALAALKRDNTPNSSHQQQQQQQIQINISALQVLLSEQQQRVRSLFMNSLKQNQKNRELWLAFAEFELRECGEEARAFALLDKALNVLKSALLASMAPTGGDVIVGDEAAAITQLEDTVLATRARFFILLQRPASAIQLYATALDGAVQAYVQHVCVLEDEFIQLGETLRSNNNNNNNKGTSSSSADDAMAAAVQALTVRQKQAISFAAPFVRMRALFEAVETLAFQFLRGAGGNVRLALRRIEGQAKPVPSEEQYTCDPYTFVHDLYKGIGQRIRTDTLRSLKFAALSTSSAFAFATGKAVSTDDHADVPVSFLDAVVLDPIVGLWRRFEYNRGTKESYQGAVPSALRAVPLQSRRTTAAPAAAPVPDVTIGQTGEQSSGTDGSGKVAAPVEVTPMESGTATRKKRSRLMELADQY